MHDAANIKLIKDIAGISGISIDAHDLNVKLSNAYIDNMLSAKTAGLFSRTAKGAVRVVSKGAKKPGSRIAAGTPSPNTGLLSDLRKVRDKAVAATVVAGGIGGLGYAKGRQDEADSVKDYGY